MAAAVLAVAAACPLLPMSFLHVPSIHLRTVKPAGQPASTSVFGPEDNVAKAGNGPKKISAQRSVVFLLDAPQSKMPVDQKREVPTSCPSFTAHSSGPCSYFCPRGPALPCPPLPLAPATQVAAENEKRSVLQDALSLSAGAGLAMAATVLAVIFSHEGMHQLPGKEMAQLAGETASFCAIFFAVIRSYLKGYRKGREAHTVLD